MTNLEIAKQLSDIGDMLEILGDPKSQFRIIAYHNAARRVEMLNDDLADIYQNKGVKGLREISGIGESIANSIEELLTKGEISYHEELIQKVPRAIVEFTKIPGVGAKIALKLFNDYHVDTIKDLKKAIMADKSEKYFRVKSKNNILTGISELSSLTGRMLLSFAEPIASDIVKTLRAYSEVKQADAVGSLRRMKETVGDIDIVASLKASSHQLSSTSVINKFISESFVQKVISHGDTKATIIHKRGVQVDLEILPSEEYGSLLQHFTGSKDHNIYLRTWAEEHGFSISEHGIKVLDKGNKLIKCDTEEKVYKTLGMQTPIPEMREDRGEIELALEHRLPKNIINLKDIKADLHLHTTWSEGETGIMEMAKACQKQGYEYCAITDHTAGLGITHGLKESDIDKYIQEIKTYNLRPTTRGFKILSGAETNIMANGKLDLPDESLKKLDLVIASIHSGFKEEKEQITSRILAAINNPNVDIIGHPSGRIIERRSALNVDWEKVFQAAGDTGTIMEINASPDRLDLTDDLVLMARKFNVKFVISTDAHSIDTLTNMRYGVAVARRGWLNQDEVMNTLPLRHFLKNISK